MDNEYSDYINQMLTQNKRRHQAMTQKFDPITGEGSTGERAYVHLPGFPVQDQWIPQTMASLPIVRCFEQRGVHAMPNAVDEFDRLRCQHDFAYWAAKYVYIKRKGGGDDILFRLTYPQRMFVDKLEQLRTQGRPIRIVLLKARQWGGSTTSQLYMAWLQLVHQTGLNSLIIAHQGTASDEIKDMFDRMIRQYPIEMLHEPGDEYSPGEKKMITVGHSGATFRVPQRNCKIKIGTAERPNSCRGGDYNLVHLSEVGLWKSTQGKKPEDIVRAACGGVVYQPNTMIVYESTANGVGNFFHREYVDARDNPRSQFRSLFVSWFDIEQNMLPVTADSVAHLSDDQNQPLHTFARWLYDNRDNNVAPSNREEPGSYLWWLWQKGATLEGINWYITERAKHSSHGSMAAECPSDDTEAFVNSGAAVFDKYRVEALRRACRPPRYIGEVVGDADDGAKALASLKFTADRCGMLSVWSMPDGVTEVQPGTWAQKLLAGQWGNEATPTYSDRYLTVVDIGGRSDSADWSVIAVIDRMMMANGGNPSVVAQWYGHCDIDILAWKAVQIAAFYDQALLVIESNTLETHDRERQIDGDQSHYILNQIKEVYPNLYARKQPEEDIRRGIPRKYGFHTNVATKPMIISTLVRVVREHLYTERDERCLNEFLVYERRQNGSYGAIIGEHDDLLMTRAIGLHICYHEMPLPRLVSDAAVAYNTRIVSAATLS